MPQPVVGPIVEEEREFFPDRLRGLALLGVFLVNAQEHLSPSRHLTDSTVRLLVQILADGKFYPLFSLLFGFGCAAQYSRHRGEVKQWPVLCRRLIALHFVGAILFVAIDDQAILLEYSVLGALLFAVCRTPARVVLILAVTSLALAVLFPFISPQRQTILESSRQTVDPSRIEERDTSDGRSLLGSEHPVGYFIDVRSRWARYTRAWPTASAPDHTLSVLAMGFFGVYCFRKGCLRGAASPGFALVRNVAGAVGIPLALFAVFRDAVFTVVQLPAPAREIAARTAWFASGPALAIFYASLAACAVGGSRADAIDIALRRAGRMALTNFIAQSVLMTILFGQSGFGLRATIGPFGGLWLVVLLWSIQLVFSWYWFSYFAVGPCEWAWRTATYLRRPAIRRLHSPRTMVLEHDVA